MLWICNRSSSNIPPAFMCFRSFFFHSKYYLCFKKQTVVLVPDGKHDFFLGGGEGGEYILSSIFYGFLTLPAEGHKGLCVIENIRPVETA